MLYELAALPSSVATHQPSQQPHHQFFHNHGRISSIQQKDYSRPLHVDCSVEYELPSQVKPPPTANGKMDPLLMIHPCYFRKIEAQRRSPFINNLPGRGGATTCGTIPTSRGSRMVKNPSCSISNYSTHTSSTSVVPNYHTRQQWQGTEAVSYSKAQLSLSSSVINSPVLGMYNSTPNGGLWNTSTHRSPLAGERFPELIHHQVPQPHVQASQVTATSGTLPPPSKNHDSITSGKYRQYLRSHRLHPYAALAGATFPQIANHQMQQIPCYNV